VRSTSGMQRMLHLGTGMTTKVHEVYLRSMMSTSGMQGLLHLKVVVTTMVDEVYPTIGSPDYLHVSRDSKGG
jgi:hypothetical protein